MQEASVLLDWKSCRKVQAELFTVFCFQKGQGNVFEKIFQLKVKMSWEKTEAL